MKCLHIITPVKDSIDSTLETVKAIMESDIWFLSLTLSITISARKKIPIGWKRPPVNGIFVWSTYQTWPTTPLPTIYWCYKQHKRSHRSRCRIADCGIGCYCQKNTLQSLYNGALQQNNAELQQLWQPMKRHNQLPLPTRQGTRESSIPGKKHCSFCCSLLTPGLLKAFDFQTLDPSKNWYDVTISHESLKRGFQNYLFTTLPVWHRPHSSRPWKQLKYKNP